MAVEYNPGLMPLHWQLLVVCEVILLLNRGAGRKLNASLVDWFVLKKLTEDLLNSMVLEGELKGKWIVYITQVLKFSRRR